MTIKGNIISSGTILSSQTVIISDKNLKENIQTIDKNISDDIILKLNPVIFNWKKQWNIDCDKQKLNYGFIAQEVELILPDLIYEYNHNNIKYKWINYIEIIPHLVSWIQNLLNKNKKNKIKIKKLQKQLIINKKKNKLFQKLQKKINIDFQNQIDNIKLKFCKI